MADPLYLLVTLVCPAMEVFHSLVYLREIVK